MKDYISSAPEAARLAEARYQRRRFPPGGNGSTTVPGPLGRPLGPRPRAAARHFDRRITVTTPLQKAGAYLLTAQMEGGNVESHRGLARRHGDSEKTAPGQGLLLHRRRANRPGPSPERASTSSGGVPCKCRVRTSTMSRPGRSRKSPTGDGQLQVPTAGLVDQHGTFQWLITAATPEGRLAHLGFTNIWAFGQHRSRV